MRLLGLEIKRVMKTKMTIIALLSAILLSFAMAYIPTTFVYCIKGFQDGEPVYATGMEAIKTRQQIEKEIEGEVTQDRIVNAVSTYQRVLKENQAEETYDLPIEVYHEYLDPIYPLFTPICNAYGNKKTATPADMKLLNADELEDFYTAADDYFNVKLMQQGKYPNAVAKAQKMRSKVTKPFVYYPGVTSDAMEYEALTLFLILLCCTVACAPVFSADYQTDADSILRCTKKGRTTLAVTKIVSALMISGICTVLCLLIWCISTTLFFGTEGMKTSVQMIASIACMLNMNMGQLIWVHAGIGLLIILSGICFTLFLSAKSKTNVQVMAMSVLACLLPLVLYWVLPERCANVLKCFLPSGGIGLNNSVLYDMVGLRFVNFGSLAIWTPYLIILATLIEIPLFIGLAIKSYNKDE
ncbi:MAG: hypothetical protein ACI4A3_02475 [Lachnospiraceae bacterium]